MQTCHQRAGCPSSPARRAGDSQDRLDSARRWVVTSVLSALASPVFPRCLACTLPPACFPTSQFAHLPRPTANTTFAHQAAIAPQERSAVVLCCPAQQHAFGSIRVEPALPLRLSALLCSACSVLMGDCSQALRLQSQRPQTAAAWEAPRDN
ncbi:hypothetical protein BDV95DRAFT_204882 [Massariosphaeria phaeospora]|uniref:Uncharacterized protein n=1 Tax=Massariosphaeria phaeospora TaxID=100035 RepID=A0A7C8M0Z7_9PLEO|nr:hypothetical protein BDV95DRAFT_204882 [Massariosphaeria phaeospora]